MTSTTPQPTLPGRAVDIVHAAVRAAGREVFSFYVQIGYHPVGWPQVEVYVMGAYPDRSEALAMFALLGIAGDEVSIVPNGPEGSILGRASADIPGICHLIIITMWAAADPAALIAAVDVARAAADEDAPAVTE